MRVLFGRFLRSEDAAITVDWVVLTAAMIALAVGVATLLIQTTTPQADNVGNAITAIEIDTSF